MSRTPKAVGSYEVERELGQGGMGVVYLARHPELERPVVLKTLRRDVARDAALEERFRREARTAAGVHHQNVVALYDCFTWRGERYIAQEYVEGRDLATVLDSVRRIEPRIAALVALELARGLEEIHAGGIVHRDLKPSNVLLGVGGQVKIADFGIALEGSGEALTKVGHAVGTPAYMSPEQLAGERPDIRSDLFTFGILLHEMLTGEPPFPDDQEGGSLLRRMEAGRWTRTRRLAPKTPRSLARIVTRCLHPRLKKRTASAADLRRTLERQLDSPAPVETRAEIAAWLWERGAFPEDDGSATRALPAPLPRRRRGRTLLRWAAAAALAGAVLAGASFVKREPLDLEKLPLLSRILEIPAIKERLVEPGDDR
ncbi:MAG: serine/threonine-protein kinase [Myxococcota bacterium]|nr:serine/threonine-protein kinase [Myxococcota bacterium]